MTTPYEEAKAVIGRSEIDWRLRATCLGLLRGYTAHWWRAHQSIEVLEIEYAVSAPLVNPATGEGSDHAVTAGVIDKLCKTNLGLTLVDHKTTSSYIDDPSSHYWRQLAVDSQSPMYELLLLAQGHRLDAVVWDVTRKPGIKPKKITKADLAHIREFGDYCGFDVTTETLAYLEENHDENEELFGYRVSQLVLDEPHKYFARRQNPRTDDQLVEFAEEVWHLAGEIEEAKHSTLHPRNPKACFNYGQSCQFLPLCAGEDMPTSDQWRPKPKRINDLTEALADCGDKTVITNSRLGVFQTCRRKSHYQYGLGIERAREDRSEALTFGTLWHAVMDAYWGADHINSKGN